MRACQGPNCGWLFLDQSRGGHRRLCSDKTCGSHARVRKFRAVQADFWDRIVRREISSLC
ncbi:CGNR zinc finger domain-containing protein [Rhizobium brockwellii]|uniref:CGNR zinc finger domain-containing protein n=1 Tax=Rhizobium brockwellii TaxID=3019932 RepID=UPI003F9BF8D2